MTKIEYWDLNDSVFAKVSENGNVVSSKEVSKEECPKSILSKFVGSNYFVLENVNMENPFEEIEEDSTKEMVSEAVTNEPVDSPAISSDELASVLSTSVKTASMEEPILSASNKDESPVSEASPVAKEAVTKPSKRASKKESKTSAKDEKYDFVQHPKHYNGHKIITKTGTFEYETIQYLESLVRRLESDLYSDESGSVYCAAKYMDRIGGGKPDGNKTVREKIAEDCKKIGWYMNHCAELIEANGFEAKHYDKEK